MPQSLSAVHIHAVSSTKLRRPFLAGATLRAELHAYLGAVSRELACPPVRVGGTEDHIHILASLGRNIAAANWIKEVKRVSSRWIKTRDPALGEFAWQNGYAAFSVSASNVKKVAAYVAGQMEHHARFDYRAELTALLVRHGVEWDEQYLWE